MQMRMGSAEDVQVLFFLLFLRRLTSLTPHQRQHTNDEQCFNSFFPFRHPHRSDTKPTQRNVTQRNRISILEADSASKWVSDHKESLAVSPRNTTAERAFRAQL